jgi:RimJ/RimL family protein N-acetyltransferase
VSEPRAAPAPSAPDRMHTERLTLSRPVRSDRDDLAALLGDPRMGRWLGGTRTPGESASILAGHIAHWDAHGFGLWIARERASRALVGRGGLNLTIAGGAGAVEVGWAVAPERWGSGLGTEIGAAAVAVARSDLGLGELVSYTLPDNIASLRVMEKLGFGAPREIDHRGLPHLLLRLRTGSTA